MTPPPNLAWEARLAVRSLRRRPALSAAAVGVLGLGIGAAAAVFSVFDGVLLRPLPFPEAQRLALIHKDDVERGYPHSPLRHAEVRDWVATSASVDAAAAVSSHGAWNATLVDSEEPSSILALPVTSGFFDVLGVRPLHGRTFVAEDDRPGDAGAIVLGHRLWLESFDAAPDVVGRSVRLLMGAQENARIVGVLPPGVEYPASTDLYVAAFGLDSPWTREGVFECDALARLKHGVSLDAARAELSGSYARLAEEAPEFHRPMRVVVTSLLDAVVGDMGATLPLLLGAVIALLVIAAFNVAGLLLVRGLELERETAIRMALGAGAGRLVAQRALEVAVLTALGAALGLVLARAGVNVLRLLAPPGAVPRLEHVGLHPGVLGFALFASVLAAAAALLPAAWQATRGRVCDALRAVPGRLPGRRALSALVVAEVAMALVVVTGSLLFARDLEARLGVDRGLARGQLVIASLEIPGSRYAGESLIAFTDRLVERVQALPGVLAATPVSVMPGTGSDGTGGHVVREGQSPEEAASNPMATFEVAHEDHFRTLGIPIVEGRAFEPGDRGNAAKVAIVSRSLASRLWPERSPVGQRFHFGGTTPWLTVIGVAEDARYRQLERQWDSVYWPPAQDSFSEQPGPGWYTPSELIVRSSLDAAALAGPLRRVVRELDAEIPVERVADVESLFARELARPRFRTSLLACLALGAVALTAIGLYGLLAAFGRQRTREIGVRLALGATRRQALSPLLRRALWLTSCGLALGTVVALWARGFTESLLFGVPALDACSFLGAALLLVLVAGVAAAGPIREAARTDCAITLRSE